MLDLTSPISKLGIVISKEREAGSFICQNESAGNQPCKETAGDQGTTQVTPELRIIE